MYHHLDNNSITTSTKTNRKRKKTQLLNSNKRKLRILQTNLNAYLMADNNNNNSNEIQTGITSSSSSSSPSSTSDVSTRSSPIPSTQQQQQQPQTSSASLIINNQQQQQQQQAEEEENERIEHSVTNCFNNNNCNLSTCRYNQLSRILHSFFNDNNQGISKLDLIRNKPEFKPNKLYIKLINEQQLNINNQDIYQFDKNILFKKLLKLFETSECYYSCLTFNKYNAFNDNQQQQQQEQFNNKDLINLLNKLKPNNNNNNDIVKLINYLLIQRNDNEEDEEQQQIANNNDDDDDDDNYYQCKLCLHYIHNPITLICGCTYCKLCLVEYNDCQLYLTRRLNSGNTTTNNDTTQTSSSSSSNNTSQSLFDYILARVNAIVNGQQQQQTTANTSNLFHISFKCKTCSFKHDQNSTKFLDSNVIIKKIQENVFPNELEVRILRNDIRKACVDSKIDFLKAIDLFEKAFNLDASNHLLLGDLFLLNYYFNQSFENCLNIVNKAYVLAPNWPFTHFMKYLTYRINNDKQTQIESLIKCLSIDVNLTYVKNKLYNLLKQETVNNEQSKSIITSDQSSSETTDSTAKSESLNSFIKLKRSASLNPLQSDFKRFHETKSSSSSSTSSSLNDNDDMITNQQDTTLIEEMVKTVVDEEEVEDDDDDVIPKDKDNFNNETTCLLIQNTQTMDSNLIKLNDLECSLCYRLFHEPVTTPCGHVFCCSCLDRVLDYNDKCPLCTKSLTDYLAERRQFKTKYLNKLIRNKFLNEYLERKKIHEDEINELMLNENEIPIFVCVLALPSIACPLHIYEPRYRLMIRRCLSTTKRFGMCTYVESNGPHRYANYGCMLDIRDANFSRDGRAYIDTIGTKRFKILDRSMKDGYNMAKIEWIVDQEYFYQQENEIQEVNQLNKEVFYLAKKWYDTLPRQKKAIILNEYGQHKLLDIQINDIVYSENGPNWHWFLLTIMPLEERMKLWFLYTTNIKARLGKLKVILALLLYQQQQQQQQQQQRRQENQINVALLQNEEDLEEGEEEAVQTNMTNDNMN